MSWQLVDHNLGDWFNGFNHWRWTSYVLQADQAAKPAKPLDTRRRINVIDVDSNNVVCPVG